MSLPISANTTSAVRRLIPGIVVSSHNADHKGNRVPAEDGGNGRFVAGCSDAPRGATAVADEGAAGNAPASDALPSPAGGSGGRLFSIRRWRRAVRPSPRRGKAARPRLAPRQVGQRLAVGLTCDERA